MTGKMQEIQKEYRAKVAEEFIKGLEQNGLEWKRGWSQENMLPANGKTNKIYKGINLFYLMLVQMKEGYKDNRWMTFKQIMDEGYHLKKGSKHEKVEYWFPYNLDIKKKVSWDEYRENLSKPIDEQERIILSVRYYQVFNGEQIEGLPERELFRNTDVKSNEIVMEISENMGVPITNADQSRAYYSPATDSITLPLMERFFSQEEYDAVCMHELAHSTGAKHRLNREFGMKGTEAYAKEELVAEITSAFMSIYTGINVVDSPIMESHKAYINGWIQDIKEDPNTLVKAIKLADQAADYLKSNAGLLLDNRIEKAAINSPEKAENKPSHQQRLRR